MYNNVCQEDISIRNNNRPLLKSEAPSILDLRDLISSERRNVSYRTLLSYHAYNSFLKSHLTAVHELV